MFLACDPCLHEKPPSPVPHHEDLTCLLTHKHTHLSLVLEAHTCLMGFAMQECMHVQYLQQRAPHGVPCSLHREVGLTSPVCQAPDVRQIWLSTVLPRHCSKETGLQHANMLGLQGHRESTEGLITDQSSGSQGAMSGTITPRGRRDPSPAELGLLKSRSVEPQVQGQACSPITAWYIS